MYFFRCVWQISFICHPERLCSMFGGSGIQVSVKGNFRRIFVGGWAETKTGDLNTAPRGPNSVFFSIQSTLSRVFKPTKRKDLIVNFKFKSLHFYVNGRVVKEPHHREWFILKTPPTKGHCHWSLYWLHLPPGWLGALATTSTTNNPTTTSRPISWEASWLHSYYSQWPRASHMHGDSCRPSMWYLNGSNSTHIIILTMCANPKEIYSIYMGQTVEKPQESGKICPMEVPRESLITRGTSRGKIFRQFLRLFHC